MKEHRKKRKPIDSPRAKEGATLITLGERNEMNKMNMQIQEYNETAAALEVLKNKYCTVFDVQTPKGLAAAREACAEVRGYRVALEKLRVEIKAPALERTRLIDAEAKRITAELLAIEEPIDAAIKAEETRKAEERAAKERAEAARVAAIQARIAAIRHCYTAAVNKTAAEMMSLTRLSYNTSTSQVKRLAGEAMLTGICGTFDSSTVWNWLASSR